MLPVMANILLINIFILVNDYRAVSDFGTHLYLLAHYPVASAFRPDVPALDRTEERAGKLAPASSLD